MGAIKRCVEATQKALLHAFYRYGYTVGSYPVLFFVVPSVVCGALAVGMLTLNPQTDTETLYAPRNSRARAERAVVEANFPDRSADNYSPYSVNRPSPTAQVIFRSREHMALLNQTVLAEIMAFRDKVVTTTMTDGGRVYSYNELCARAKGSCVIEGAFILSPLFWAALQQGAVTYPLWKPADQTVDLRSFLANVTVSPSGVLSAASVFKIGFPLRRDTVEAERLSLKWELEFLKLIKVSSFTLVEPAYRVSKSLNLELDRGTQADVYLFSLTFALMVTYASLASLGGDCVSTRALLANGGVLASLLGILGALGLTSMLGVRYVNIVGSMPFLTLGIGVDDMFLLMSAWSETLSSQDLTVPERIGNIFKKAGIGITITSVTDFLAFMVGSTSVFTSVENFCIYTGIGVLLCYICNITIFGACLTFHGRRVFSRRHTITCRPVTKSRGELQAEGGKCHAILCGGQIPVESGQDQSPCEMGPRVALPRFLMLTPVRILVILVFSAYLGVAIWGCTKLEQGLEGQDLVLTSSYYLKYLTWEIELYGRRMPVSFVHTGGRMYSTPEVLQDTQDILTAAHAQTSMDDRVNICWLTQLASTALYNTTSEATFITGVHQFLELRPHFYNDVVFSPDNKTIVASRCHVISNKLLDSNDQARLMTQAREVADGSRDGVFAFCLGFVMFEQFVIILSSTLQTVGYTVAVMFVVTAIFLPHPIIVCLVMVQVLMILIGVFGFMAHWNLTLSTVTMIHLIMSVGFSVDFCAHVCTAYMVSEETTRRARAIDSVVHASGPILNGGISSLLGISILFFTESYIFRAFCKVMLLVIGFGAAHAIFLVPVVLSVIGPNTYLHVPPEETRGSKGTGNGHSTQLSAIPRLEELGGSDANVAPERMNKVSPSDSRSNAFE